LKTALISRGPLAKPSVSVRLRYLQMMAYEYQVDDLSASNNKNKSFGVAQEACLPCESWGNTRDTEYIDKIR